MASKFGLESLYQISDKTSAYVILGSASNVDQELSWHTPLAEFINKELLRNIPTLGICFGHQLMADYYGCQVGFLTNDRTYFKEKRKITFTKKLSSYDPGHSTELVYAHEQAVLEISNAFEIIAESDRSPFECLKHKDLPLLTTQSHPEASEKFIQEYLGETIAPELIKNGQDFIQAFLEEYQVLN